MTEIRFYHLQTQTPEAALPQILQKALAGERRIVIRMADDKAVEKLNDLLWTFSASSFLPHGSRKDGFAEDQPIWLTDKDENPNQADVLILTDGVSSENVADYKLCCEMLDGRDGEAVKAAREKWKSYKESGYEVTYWQQNEKGGWDKKA
ncbi:MAG: DNA polymerase III subunit chi [Alphaproteobacteria bacterium CG_4_9_14_3_um_filter_47_13]|nr:MAG: DNA polymerase III subunit chi [Alphaproteobacteria bacterium CG_4_9_14_3_um_filter_47_13]